MYESTIDIRTLSFVCVMVAVIVMNGNHNQPPTSSQL
jgi:hypothetical protein